MPWLSDPKRMSLRIRSALKVLATQVVLQLTEPGREKRTEICFLESGTRLAAKMNFTDIHPLCCQPAHFLLSCRKSEQREGRSSNGRREFLAKQPVCRLSWVQCQGSRRD